MTMRTECPACKGSNLEMLYHLPAIPVQSVVLLDTADEAKSFPTGALSLTVCKSCGFMFNSTFDASLVDYAATTEESQHFSGTFNQFARALATEIANRDDLTDRLTLEVGCGKGDFLEELVAQTGTRAIGVDPGFIPERQTGSHAPITYIRKYFHPEDISDTPDLVVCRHTLEHIDTVADFMTDIMAVSGPQTAVMFETPDAARVLAEGAFWDIYHEHCSYFTIGSHARLFRRVGLDVTQSYLAYGGQYIIQYAQPGNGPPQPEEDDLDEILGLAQTFPEKASSTRALWAERVQDAYKKGRTVALWGGGSKAVAFLTTIGLGPEIRHVIDINAYKQGKYIPGTGHRVAAPEALLEDPPALVVAMNPVYLNEIKETLEGLDLAPELCALG